jgi:5-methylcytosine-specific restriction endonuclease McrA
MALRRVSGARIEQSGFWVFTTYRFYYTKTQCFALTRSDYRRLSATRAAHGVAEVGRDGDRVLWWSDGGFYWGDPELDAEAVELLLWNRQRQQTSQLDRLRKIRLRTEEIETSRRERIPDEVKVLVWERDDGRCVRCGAEEDLQFDHIIPVAKGGGVDGANIQILCGDCNRAKSASIV